MMNWIRKVPWWLWLVLPGGAVLALIARKNAPKAADIGTPATRSSNQAAAQDATLSLIDRAKATADALRQGLQNDPLAATLAGVNPQLIAVGDPSKVAADTSAADALRQQIADSQASLSAAKAGYNVNHNGGQTPGQEAEYEGSISATINSLMAKLSALVGA